MKLHVVVVGRVRGPLAEAVAEYERRTRRYWKLSVVEVVAGAGRTAPPERVREAEGERILTHVPPGHTLVAVTRRGTSMDSRRLARFLEDLGLCAAPGATFVIGGAFGLSPSVVERAQRRLALSSMTMPHEMARLVLTEQLYRAGTIIRGEPYHKGT